MSNVQDWRLETTANLNLEGRSIEWVRWTAPKESWDHDHCVFCWQKFMEADIPDVQHYGWHTEDGQYWICQQCFVDFKDRFNWKVIERKDDDPNA